MKSYSTIHSQENSTIYREKWSGTSVIKYARKCPSESQDAIEDILNEIDKKFGKPSGITCDMRSGIISAAQSVFPNTPIRICLMHFLRDLGKELMKNMHTDLGIMINRKGIKSPLTFSNIPVIIRNW